MLFTGNSSVLGALRRGTHMLDEIMASALLCDDAVAAMQKTDEDPDAQAFLMLELLKSIALDPTQGETPDRFFRIYDDEVIFTLHLDRWSNFITSCLCLPHGSRANQLIEAIQENLNSRMFKAAKMSRRLDKRFNRLYQQARNRAEKIAYAGEENLWSWPKDRRDEADSLYRRIFEKREETLLNRLRKVSAVASPGLQGGFTEAVAKFLYNHLPIQ